MRKACLAAAMLLTSGVAMAQGAAPSFIARQVPDAGVVGQGRLRFMTMDIYDAVLYAPHGRWRQDAPFALSLTYLRHLRGTLIADRAVQEIRREGFTDSARLAVWHDQMQDIFPDVDNGTTLTAIGAASGATIFYRDGRPIGRIDDPAFGGRFFGIWFASNTSGPGLRAKLLHLSN